MEKEKEANKKEETLLEQQKQLEAKKKRKGDPRALGFHDGPGAIPY